MDDEYLFKIAMDATDFNAALEAMRSMLGQVQDAVGGSVRQFANADSALAKVQASITGTAAASGNLTAETRKQAEGFAALSGELKDATDLYRTFREEQVVGSGNTGKDVYAYELAELQKLVDTYEAQNASFITAARARLKAEQETADGIAAAHKAEAESLTILAGATERFNGLANSAQRRTVGNAYTVVPSDGSASEQQLAESQAALKQLQERYALMERVTSLRRTPTDGLVANSAARNIVGNAYTVQPADGTGSQAEIDASQQVLAQMREHYAALQKETAARKADADETRRQSTAFQQEEAARSRTNAALNSTVTGLQRTTSELPRLRYALYDISTTFTILGVGMEAYGAGIAKVSVDYEAAFASVARTSKGLTNGQLQALKGQLVDLSTQIPATFEDITKVATLGNQLNVPAQSLAGFTKTVTEFAAASNVSVDIASTAFGRLGQIFKTTNYQGLGDEIAYLGVRAVATEADIIKVSQQIAVTTNAYGISVQNTLALATAYASLGVKAESARGTTVRFLADLQKAVVQGGAPLAQIADVTGMSGKAFSNLFNDDANAAATKFLQGLSRYGRDSKNVLAELGITAQRDITNINLLAQNTDVLTAAQHNATQAGGALDAMFKKQTDTIQAQLVVAGNKVKAMFDDIGKAANGPLRGAVDLLNGLLDILDRASKDPVVQFTLLLSAGVVTLGGAFLVGTGLAAQYAASILAVRTYMQAMGVQGNSLRGIISAVTGSTAGATQATFSYSDALRSAVSAEAFAAANDDALAASRRTVDVETARAAVAEAQLNLQLAESAGVREGVVAQTLALTKAQADLNLALAQVGLSEAEARLKALGLAASLDEVTWATARLEAATGKLSAAQDAAAIAARNQALGNQEGALANLANAEDSAANSGGKLANALGKAGIIGSMLALLPIIPMAVDALQQWRDQLTGATTDADKLERTILGLQDAQAKDASAATLGSNMAYANGSVNLAVVQNGTTQVSNPTVSGARLAYNYAKTGDYLPGKTGLGTSAYTLNNQGSGARDEFAKADTALTDLVQKGHLKEAQAGFDFLTKGLNKSDQSAKVLNTLLPNLAGALKVTGNASIDAAFGATQSSNAADQQAKSFKTIVDAAFAAGSGLSQLQTDMGGLGKAFATSGAEAAINGGQLKTVVSQIIADAGSGPAAASQIQGLFDTLVKGGFASATQLKPLLDIVNALTQGKGALASAPAGIDELLGSYNKAAAAAQKAAQKAAEAASAVDRTLKDYANDINNTISSMLSYQFGVGDAQDKITQTWNQIKSDAASAAVSAKSIRTDLLALNATKTTATFALAVDSAYGDVAATAQDRATIAKANDEIAGKQKDLKKATDDSSMSLVGNSDASIKNRQALEGQISGYQAYIVALAQSGASQKQIDDAIAKSKQQFIQHATQLGYNRQQVDKLATAFDGMRQIVNAIPRNITTGVTAKTSAAMKALADYQAAIKKTNTMSVDTPIGTTPKNLHDLGIALGKQFLKGLEDEFGAQAKFDFMYTTPKGQKERAGSMILTPAAQAAYGADRGAMGLGFASGGWTGNGGRYDFAGFVHGQEFVLNNIGARMLPMADLNAMNQGRAPQSMSPTVVIAGGGKGQGFTTQDKLFLAQVLGAKPSITLSADQFGHAVDGANVRANLRGAG